MRRIEVFGSLAEAEATWRRFEEAGAALPYQRYDWIATWCATVSDAAAIEPCPVAVHDDDGQPLLLLPLGIRPATWRKRPARVLTWLGDSLGDQLAPILCGRAGELGSDELTALWSQIIASVPDADVLTLQNQPAEVYGIPNPLLHLPVREHGHSHSTCLGDDWDAYFKSKAKSTRRGDSRRQLRRLGEHGEVELRLVNDPDERQLVVKTMIAQKRRRYEETGRADMFADETFADFYQRLTAEHPELIQIAVLSVDGVIIATDWSAVGQRTFHGLVTTHEGGDWRQYSPGRLLLEWVLAWCCHNGIEVFDFSTGDEQYKKEWCERSTPVYRAEIPLSARARLAALPGRVKRRLAASDAVRSLRERFD